MTRALRIGSVFGIALEVHFSWLFALGLAVVSLAGQVGGLLVALATSLAFFAGLVAHELAHALVARRLGIQVRSITLFVFGGIASLVEEPRRPRDEVAIAAAGPIASVLIAAASFGLSRIAPAWIALPLAWLAKANLALAVFNVLPGFPLDGGRIARAAIWAVKGDMIDATLSAAWLGRAVAWSLIALGGWGAFTGTMPSGLWMALVGWFLLRASAASAADAAIKRTLGDATAADALRVDFPAVRAGIDVATYVEGVVFPTGERVHLVNGTSGPLGVVSYGAALAIPRSLWHKARVADIVTPLEDLPAVAPGTMLREVLPLVSTAPAVRIVDPGGLVGMIDRDRLVALVSTAPEPRVRHARVATAAVAVAILATACTRTDAPRATKPTPTPTPVAEVATSQTVLECATMRDVAESDVVRVVGDRIYYAAEARGLTVVQLDAQGEPRLVGASPFVGTPISLWVEQGVAWMAYVDWEGTTSTVIRAVDAMTMTTRGEKRIPGVVQGVELVGDVLYVLRERDGKAMIASFRVEKKGLSAIAELPLQGAPARLAASAAGLAVVTTTDVPLVTWVDLPYERPGALVAQGTSRLEGGFPTTAHAAGRTIDADEDHRVRIVRCASAECVPSEGAVLEMIDFAKTGLPKKLGSLEIASHGIPVTRFYGERLFVADVVGRGDAAKTELRVVRTEKAPRTTGRATLRGVVTAIVPREERLLLVGTSGSPESGVRVSLHDVDVRDPAKPIVRGGATFGSDWTWTPAEESERALSFDLNASLVALPYTASGAAGYETGAQVVDLGGRAPRLAGTYVTPEWVERVVLMGGRIVAIGPDGVHVVDHGREMR